MNSKIEVNDLCAKEKTINKKFNDKTILKNLCDIKFNLEELDILTKEVKGDKINNNGIKEDNSLINIKLNNDEIDILFNEINNNGEYMNDKKKLTKKRKRNFISVKNQQQKDNFIYYKPKNRAILNKDICKNKVSILSYNILNQIFMKKLNRPDLDIDDRMHKIKNEILELNPDIFCLQEADIYVYKEYLLQKDMEQYNILYGINCGSSFINIIAYKKDKFKLKSFKNFSLLFLGKFAGNRGIMTIDLEFINDLNNNSGNYNINLKENNNKNTANNKFLTIYNVHFPWKYENDRILLLNILFKHIKENHNINEHNNIVIVGDFNSEPPSRTIKMFYYNKIKNDKRNFYIKKYKKKNFDLQTFELSQYIFNNFKFQSAYQCYSKSRIIKGDIMRHPLFTSRTKFYKRTIDYIFFSKNLQLNKIIRLPKYYNVDKEKFLPSKEYPSDHLKLFAEFSL
jgi:mRNA deadenylase 3'-5' endonuclease subunit Ccr4